MPERTQRPLADPLTEDSGVIDLLRAGALTLDGQGRLDIAAAGIKAGMIDYGGDLTNDNGTLKATTNVPDSTQSAEQSAGYFPFDHGNQSDGDTSTTISLNPGSEQTFSPASTIYADGVRIWIDSQGEDSIQIFINGDSSTGTEVFLDGAAGYGSWVEGTFPGSIIESYTIKNTNATGTLYLAEVQFNRVPLPSHTHQL
jgi:hypothetical protein